jgi:hypothetical protein
MWPHIGHGVFGIEMPKFHGKFREFSPRDPSIFPVEVGDCSGAGWCVTARSPQRDQCADGLASLTRYIKLSTNHAGLAPTVTTRGLRCLFQR